MNVPATTTAPSAFLLAIGGAAPAIVPGDAGAAFATLLPEGVPAFAAFSPARHGDAGAGKALPPAAQRPRVTDEFMNVPATTTASSAFLLAIGGAAPAIVPDDAGAAFATLLPKGTPAFAAFLPARHGDTGADKALPPAVLRQRVPDEFMNVSAMTTPAAFLLDIGGAAPAIVPDDAGAAFATLLPKGVPAFATFSPARHGDTGADKTLPPAAHIFEDDSDDDDRDEAAVASVLAWLPLPAATTTGAAPVSAAAPSTVTRASFPDTVSLTPDRPGATTHPVDTEASAIPLGAARPVDAAAITTEPPAARPGDAATITTEPRAVRPAADRAGSSAEPAVSVPQQVNIAPVATAPMVATAAPMAAAAAAAAAPMVVTAAPIAAAAAPMAAAAARIPARTMAVPTSRPDVQVAGDVAQAPPVRPKPSQRPSSTAATVPHTPLPQALAAPTMTVRDPIAPAGQVFAAAIHRMTVPFEPANDDRIAAPALADMLVGGPTGMSAAVHAPVAPDATLDTTQRRWPETMIARIELLRDAHDAAAARIDTGSARASSAQLRLVPDALGAVDVSLRREGEQVHVRLHAEQPHAQALLADAQSRLAELADARGIRLSHAVATTAGDGGGQQQRHNAVAEPATILNRTAAAEETDGGDLRIA